MDDVEPHAIRFMGYSWQNYLKFRAMSFLYRFIASKSPSYLNDSIKIDDSSRSGNYEVLYNYEKFAVWQKTC